MFFIINELNVLIKQICKKFEWAELAIAGLSPKLRDKVSNFENINQKNFNLFFQKKSQAAAHDHN